MLTPLVASVLTANQKAGASPMLASLATPMLIDNEKAGASPMLTSLATPPLNVVVGSLIQNNLQCFVQNRSFLRK